MSDFAAVKKGQQPESNREQETPGITGKDSMGRRVWDKEYFAKKSQEEGQPLPKIPKVISTPSESLKARQGHVDIDSKVKDRKVVSVSSSKSEQGGFYCNTCDVHFHDSDAYLAHINSKAHNRLLGMNMKVESVSVEKVRQKLKRMTMAAPPAEPSYRQRLKVKDIGT
jgi:U4/U6.U5 tri-snRNP component SNU23